MKQHKRSRKIHQWTISDCDKVRSGQKNPKRQKEKQCEHLRGGNTNKSGRNRNIRKYSSNKFLINYYCSYNLKEKAQLKCFCFLFFRLVDLFLFSILRKCHLSRKVAFVTKLIGKRLLAVKKCMCKLAAKNYTIDSPWLERFYFSLKF